jgi:hypothetical protein
MNILTVILLLILIVIVGVYLIKDKLIKVLSSSLKLGFVGLILVALSAILIPGIYEKMADWGLHQAGTYTTIQQWDKSLPISQLQNAPQNLWDLIQNAISGNNSSNQNSNNSPGFFEKNLYPSLVSTVSLIIRLAVIIISFIGLISIVYISYLSLNTLEVSDLQSEVHQLQQKINSLEEQYQQIAVSAS